MGRALDFGPPLPLSPGESIFPADGNGRLNGPIVFNGSLPSTYSDARLSAAYHFDCPRGAPV